MLHRFTSSIVLDSRYGKPFVQNRVAEIREKLPPSLWNHCPGIENPADLPSRGTSLSELSTSELWKHGPDWLPEVALTNQGGHEASPQDMPVECTPELKVSTHNLLTTTSQPLISKVIDCENYGSLLRLVRTTAQVLRAVKRFKREHIPKPTHPTLLTTAELSDAERLWISEAQRTLTNSKNFNSWRTEFGIFLDDDGLFRCGGRLTNANILSYSAKHPVFLPQDHHFTVLIVKDAHHRVGHDGVKETLTEIRRKFWVVKGRSLVSRIIHHCVLCRRFEGRHFQVPPAPPLPAFRVTEDPPFSYTGVDFAGPLYVRTFGLMKSNKVWICLFTCLVTRAVHLDIVTDLTTETFMRCLKRFAGRRGLPRMFLSDNGKTFKAAAQFIDTVFKDATVQEYLAGQGVEWKFNIEKTPWWGGAFERLVKSTKRCLRKMVRRSKLSFDELQTLLVEVEAIINSRPLSYVSATDIEEPLTPSHLLMGRRVLSLPDNLGHAVDLDYEDFNPLTSTQLETRLKRLNESLNYFWTRWRDEYLAELRDTHRQHISSTSQPKISEGDIVVIHDEDLPRGFWKFGRVKSLIVGRDKQIRARSHCDNDNDNFGVNVRSRAAHDCVLANTCAQTQRWIPGCCLLCHASCPLLLRYWI